MRPFNHALRLPEKPPYTKQHLSKWDRTKDVTRSQRVFLIELGTVGEFNCFNVIKLRREISEARFFFPGKGLIKCDSEVIYSLIYVMIKYDQM